MGAASSIKPASVAPESQSVLAAASKSRFYGVSEDGKALGASSSPVDSGFPGDEDPRENIQGFRKFSSDPTFSAFPSDVPNNLSSTIAISDLASSALKTADMRPAADVNPNLLNDVSHNLHTAVNSSSTLLTAPQTIEKLRLINAAAVNGEKSNLLRMVDGNSRLFWVQDDFGR